MATATQLAQACVRVVSGSSLVGVQASNCGSNKYRILTYLAKNNNNESIQTVSDEDNRMNANSATLCACKWDWKTRL